MQNVYVGNRGYFGLKKQVDATTAIVPTIYIPYYAESMKTIITKHRQNTVKGNRMYAQDTHQGLRSHTGEVTVLCEPNTIGYLMDMLLTKSSTSGGGPYTHVFGIGDTENYYTVDIKKGNYVERYVGVKANSFKPTYVDGVMQASIGLSALKTFKVATLSGTPTGVGPYTVALNTDYDPSPTTGLVVGDIVKVGSVDAIVASIPSVSTFTCVADVSAEAAGAQVYIRAATPSFTLLTPFHWGRTEYRFSLVDAATALSATHTPLDEGTEFSITHANEADEGAHQTGAYDPTDLRRLTVDGEVNMTRVFDTLNESEDFMDNNKKALVIRMFAGNTTTYELRITFNNLKVTEQAKDAPTDTIVKIVQKLQPQYDTSDSQGLAVTVINNVSTI